MIITKALTLVAAPVPTFVGTKLRIVVPDDSLVWGIFSLTKSETSKAVTIEWGDGETTVCTEKLSKRVDHTYATGGEYWVQVSDDVTAYCFSSNYASEYQSVYAAMIREVSSNATRLVTLGAGVFMCAENMIKADFSEATALDTALPSGFENCATLSDMRMPFGFRKLYSRIFGCCNGLHGALYFPSVDSVVGSGENSPPFLGSANITEIHFAATSEETIRNSGAYKVSETLGAPNAVLVFDL